MNHVKKHWLLVILPILGISYWFLLAFPLADRNESYVWIAYLNKYSFIEIIQNPIPTVRNFRPLAQALTWSLYHLSGSNGILVQWINFILLCVAIWVMISLIEKSKSLYARLFYLIIGFIYFSSFYYIFNLHGIFYSPILLLITLLLRAEERVLTHWKIWTLSCFILALFHPFILIFFAAYVTGWLIEKHQFDRNKIILLVLILSVLLIVLKLLLPFPIFSVIDIKNLIGTARNVEIQTITKIFTLFLCLLTLLNKTRQQQKWLLAISALYLTFAILYNLPFLLLLASLIVVSLVIEKKWSLAGLVVAAISFPIVVGSGAPTKACIFIFLLPYLLLRNLSFPFVIKDWIPKTISLGILTGIICFAILNRLEAEIPLLSSLTRPILVEKGKSYQLERALILAQQQIPQRRIQFLQEKQVNIRDHGQPIQRDNFPPTRQKELDTYQQYALTQNAWSTLPTWYIAFGTELPSDTLTLVYTLEEKNCNAAYIYAPLRSAEPFYSIE